MPARTQTRRPALAVPPAPGGAPRTPVLETVYVARRVLKVGDRRVMPGEVVLGADRWPRLESWVRSGAVEEVIRERADAG